MADMEPNFGVEADAIAQQVVAPAADAPLEGVDFLLNAIGFNNLAERLRLMQAGLTEYEDFRYLVEKDI
jgi:hypothetical protein